jgi:hypothetical protein
VQQAEAALAAETDKWRHLAVSTAFDEGEVMSPSFTD